MASIDPRVILVGITIDGTTTWYDNYKVTAKGTKVTSTLMGECEITITGINSDLRNSILRSVQPGTGATLGKVSVTLDVGRESYGAATYFKGDVYRAYPLKKPNLGVMLKCLTGQSYKSDIVQRGGISELTALSSIAQWVADDNGYTLSFGITDSYIRNYSFTGSANESLMHLEDLANCDVYVDNDVLYLKKSGEQASGTNTFEVNNDNGTLIEANATENGVSVKMLFNPNVTIGSVITIASEINPSLDGSYTVYKCNFDVETRGTNFYLTVEGQS